VTKAQAVTVVGDLVNAGYDAHAYPVSASVWQVDACSTTGPIDTGTIQGFASAHGVTAKADRATFS